MKREASQLGMHPPLLLITRCSVARSLWWDEDAGDSVDLVENIEG
jgi:hypothetical protein